MKDLYRHLGVSESAGDDAIRAALPSADPQTRDAAEFILLDPRRRVVYDRNRRTVATIGRLRANLGLNLTRFWPRSRFADFTIDLGPRPQARPVVMDGNAIAWAFGFRAANGGPSGQATRWSGRLVFLMVAIVLIALLAVGYAWLRG